MLSSTLPVSGPSMILYKTIALQFGRFLETGRPGNEFDLVGRKSPTDETRFNRRAILTDLAAARIYLLDHRAANYLDSLRMDVQGMPRETRDESEIQSYVRDVDFPRELVWVEYDTRQLWMDRVARGLTTMAGLDLRHFSQRGFLFDNRSENVMTVRLFNGMTDRSFLEPLATLVLRKSGGRPEFTDAVWQPQMNVLMAHARGDTDEHVKDVQALLEEHKGHVSYEMVIGFMLFAALAAREDDLLSEETASLSPEQTKTARKFGKTWMTETLRSHVTIRIGPSGERHLVEREARRQFEAARASGRATPTEHWVSEHERRYSSGKVVRVRGHKRGIVVDKTLPIRVVGPKLEL
jgi:hypothetical protein